MDMRHGLGLFTQFRIGMPNAIKENKHNADVMTVSNIKKLINTLDKPLLILLPYQMMEIDPHAIEAEIFCPSQFLINRFEIKGFSLPHFKLIYSRPRSIISSNKRSCFFVPLVGFFYRPSLACLFRFLFRFIG